MSKNLSAKKPELFKPESDKRRLAIVLVLAFSITFFIGWLAGRETGDPKSNTLNSIREPEGKYKYINPLLAADSISLGDAAQIQPLHKEIRDFVNEKIGGKAADRVSVYFRDIKTGWWFGINSTEKYTPGSLLKVPTMIALFKLAESKHELLSEEITYDGKFDDNKFERFKPAKAIKPGQTYTVEELIRAMIAYSDNNATRLLHQKIDQETLMEVYRDLGIAIPETSGAVDFMTVNSYSYFFRILYNATYLTREYSEKAMEYLSEIDFPEGIAGGLPANTQTAKKFGERNIVFENSNQNYKELHDCGYVYYPGHPYLICIMTKGADFDKLAEVIKEISSRTYNWIDKQYITPESKTPK